MLQKHSITLASAVVYLPVMHSAHEYMLMRNAINFALVYKQVKLSGVMDNCSVFDQLATVREVDLYGLWMPFVAASTLVAQIGKVELLDYFEVNMST
jgi:hypothetical protein